MRWLGQPLNVVSRLPLTLFRYPMRSRSLSLALTRLGASVLDSQTMGRDVARQIFNGVKMYLEQVLLLDGLVLSGKPFSWLGTETGSAPQYLRSTIRSFSGDSVEECAI